MIKIDARGLSCPEPLMMVADAMKRHPGEELQVLVSELHTKTNIENYVHEQKRNVEVKTEGFDIELTIR